MKAILLFTAALFAVSSALPFYENLKNQQTSNLCVSLSYSPSSDTAFTHVHVCNTPGEGKYAQSFPIRHPLPARSQAPRLFIACPLKTHWKRPKLGVTWYPVTHHFCCCLQVHASCHLFQDAHWKVWRTQRERLQQLAELTMRFCSPQQLVNPVGFQVTGTCWPEVKSN